jgi:hypothetical protein
MKFELCGSLFVLVELLSKVFYDEKELVEVVISWSTIRGSHHRVWALKFVDTIAL